MNRFEIIELWKSKGWSSIEAYRESINSCSEMIVLDQLDPDIVDPAEFWSAAEEHFGTDCVCNSKLNCDKLSIFQSNTINYNIAKYVGMLWQLDVCAQNVYKMFGKVDIAEIGCGYGSFKIPYTNIENRYLDKTSYTGFDIIKRIDECIVVGNGDGTFSSDQVFLYTEKFNLFYSANTFQHLSKLQIRKYLDQVYKMLPHGGYFCLMYVKDVEKTYHYGQVVETLEIKQLEDCIKQTGFELFGSSTMNVKNSITPYCLVLKKE